MVKSELMPDVVFTHYRGDLNIDHRVTCDAVLTATRPMSNESVKEVYSFEVLSSTEWNYPLTFSPNVFFDITESIEAKIRAMACYKSELREYPHPRSLDGIRKNAETWAFKHGIAGAVEAFYLMRCII